MDVRAALPGLLKTIEDQGEMVTKDANNKQAHVELLNAARELVSMLESPVERICRMVYLEVCITRPS
jgi:hypothetical protein